MKKLNPPGRDNSSSNRGQQAVSEILMAARDVLVEEGYPRLTMRNIAKRAGITVGNLNYYYGNKQDLLHDLLEAVIQGYVEDFDRITDDPEKSPTERLEEIVRFIMIDLGTKETTGFFPALWALANHDDFAAREMDRMYAIERNVIAKVIAQVRPDLARSDVDTLALFVSGSIEGQTMFIGHRRMKRALAAEVTNVAVFSFVTFISAIEPAAIRGMARETRAGKRRAAS